MPDVIIDEGQRGCLPRVLVVDDDLALSKGVQRALEAHGFVVSVVNRAPLALEAAATFRPDLVVLDVMMPEMDGWEVLGRMRASAGLADTPVIMLTAADSEGAKIRGFSLGADDYVTKPFSVQVLRYRIAAVLRRSRAGEIEEDERLVPVVGRGSVTELIRCRDIYFVEGIRNYTYVHSAESRFLSRLTLGAIEAEKFPGLRRVHRSFIVNMDHVKGAGWASKSSYRLRLADSSESEIPVSRALVPDIQRQLGLKS